jgi:NADH:ubiquinone oxidoreductase subunit
MKDWYAGATKFAKKNGYTELARRFFIDKDIRYMLSSVKKVGEDQFGNEYFEDNGTVDNPQMKTRQRIVRYGGENNVVFNLPVETSAVPPEWFAWLHHMDDRVPPSGEKLAPAAEKFVDLESGMSGPVTPNPYDHVAEWRPNQTTRVPILATSATKGTQYKQPGHHGGGNHRISTYESWTPSTEPKMHVKTHGNVPVSSVEGGASQL